MISPHHFGTITSGAIDGLTSIIRSKGGRPEEVYARIGLPPEPGGAEVLPLASFTATLQL